MPNVPLQLAVTIPPTPFAGGVSKQSGFKSPTIAIGSDGKLYMKSPNSPYH
jgi:hypothetical protein